MTNPAEPTQRAAIGPRLRRAACAALAGPLLVFALSGTAAAQGAAFTWRTDPAGPNASTGHYEFSSATNWAGDAPANDSRGTFSFPSQSNPCDTQQFCDNDLSGLVMTGLNIDTSVNYIFTGKPITLSGPLTMSASGLRAPTQAWFRFPLALEGDQRWSVAGSPDGPGGADVPSELIFQDALTGAGSLDVALSTAGQLVLDGDNELGAVRISGDPSRAGANADASGTAVVNDRLNATSGAPVTVDHAFLAASVPGSYAVAQSGPLRLLGGDLQIGTLDPYGPASGLTVNGSFSADPSSRMTFAVESNSEQADADYAQLSASGPISLAGGLDLRFGTETAVSCAPPEPGMRYTLITTPDTLTGTFAGLPGGSVVSVHGVCPDGGVERSAPVRLDYTPHSVLGSVVGTTTILAGLNPNPSVAGQAVTLNAAVSASYGNSSGTVDFTGPGGSAIPGCAGVPTDVGFNGQSTAQCTTTALTNGESVVATYEPDLHSFSPPARSAPVVASVTGPSAGDSPAGPSPSPAVPASSDAAAAGPSVTAAAPESAPPSLLTSSLASVPKPGFALGTPAIRGDTASVPVSCSAGGATCMIVLELSVVEIWRHGRLVATTAGTRRMTVLGRARVSLAPGQTRLATLVLNRAGSRLLSARHRVTVRLGAACAGAPRVNAFSSRSVVFTSPKRPARSG